MLTLRSPTAALLLLAFINHSALIKAQAINYDECPPSGALDALTLKPGECASTYVCVDNDPAIPHSIIAKNSYEDAFSKCETVRISLRCGPKEGQTAPASSELRETVVYEQFGMVPDKKCDHAIIEFGRDGKIFQRCCKWEGGGQDVVKGKDDKKGEDKGGKGDKKGEEGNCKCPDVGEGKKTTPLRRCDVDPDLPCPEDVGGKKGLLKAIIDDSGNEVNAGDQKVLRRCDVDPDLPCPEDAAQKTEL